MAVAGDPETAGAGQGKGTERLEGAVEPKRIRWARRGGGGGARAIGHARHHPVPAGPTAEEEKVKAAANRGAGRLPHSEPRRCRWASLLFPLSIIMLAINNHIAIHLILSRFACGNLKEIVVNGLVTG